MILNSQNIDLIKSNAHRLADSIHHKDELADFATAGTYEQVISSLETMFMNTNMFFDDELLCFLNEETWKSFKSSLLLYTLNIVNQKIAQSPQATEPIHENRDYYAASAEL